MKLDISGQSLDQLEFKKIDRIVRSYCKGPAAMTQYSEHTFFTDVDQLQKGLAEVEDITNMIREREPLHLYEYEDITDDLYMLSKTCYVLESKSVLKILDVLKNYQEFVSFFKKDRISKYSNLYQLGALEHYDDTPIKLIERVFDEHGEVRPNASPALLKIIKRIESLSKEINKKFNDIVRKYKIDAVLAESGESVRNGRRVLVLPSENKRRIEGVIHDQSSTGKTVYLEPQEIMSSNNELYTLENEKRAEVYKILKNLSHELSSYRTMIVDVYERLGKIDLTRAKGVLSYELDGTKPKISAEADLTLKEARHPVLVLQESKGGHKTIPFDLDLHGKNRMLLISGPNAGGKSVTLKAVGLIHLMVYAGILVPVDAESVIGTFTQIFTDIGDQQSIDEGLSTYSSHLRNLKNILDKADKKSLILLDEIGSGTDPKLGGAIAEGVLDSLLYKKVSGVVTTHYSQLKVYAFQKKGIINGAMLFDKQNLAPTYRLKVGKPGSSYAFEVAKKVGLSHHVLKYATKKVGKAENQVEELLIDLQDGKAILDEQLHYVEAERKKLDKLIQSYNEMAKEYEVKRKKLKIKAKEIEYKRANEENLELQKLINKLEKEKDVEKVRSLKEQARTKRNKESEEIVDLRRDVISEKKEDEVINEGDHVKMLEGDMKGEVLHVKGNKATVLFGIIKMEVSLSDITLTQTQLDIKKHKSINLQGVTVDRNFSSKLDIRGYKMKDAEDTLEEYFDKAIIHGVRNLEIIHGKGKGALRKLVIRKMKEYRDFTSYHHAPDERGGDGVTFITM